MPQRPFETGDVVWSPDPYHTDDPELAGLPSPRPWLILSTAKYPNQGDDYVACALTSNTRADENAIPLAPKDWTKGQPPKPSQIDPQTIMTLKHHWAKRYLGRVADAKVNLARSRVRSFL